MVDELKTPYPREQRISEAPPDAAAREAMRDFNRLTATFRDEGVENEYRRFLTTRNLPRQRLVWLVMTGVYALYGALDVLTIEERLTDILIMRLLIITPLALLLGALTFIPRLKPYTGHFFAACVFLSAMSVTWMISILPPQGAPPYIVGILIIFIFSSCNVQMPFTAATAAYALTTMAYAYVVLSNPEFSRVDVISGLFFMFSSAGAAIATNYIQEMRLRMIWRQNELRARDARRIEELMIEATAADNSKLNFLSVLTHELRTPLHQVIGLSEVARDQIEKQSLAEAPALLTQVIDSAQSQLKKIGQMLRYADATAGRLSFNVEDTPVRELTETLFDQFAEKAAARGVNLTMGRVDNALVAIDPHHAAYALANIVDNAINASAPGRAVEITGRSAGEDDYEIVVADHGCGMSAERLAKVFSPFDAGDQGYGRASGGVGLGLTLAQRLLAPQEGRICLQSTEGMGTTVTITFKRAAAKLDPARAAS